MKYYIIAGEASGDLHASNLMKALSDQDADAEFRCWGGDLMQAQGGTLVKHIKELAFMGFVEVIANLRTILGNMKLCKADIEAYAPDAVILVDYPGFNLRIAEHVKSLGIPVIYYISPQVWAWKQSRVKKIKRDVDRMLVILPFEKEFYQSFDYEVEFVGHPLLDAIANFSAQKPSFEKFCQEHQLDDRPIITLLPGSRTQEIKVKLPIMLSMVKEFPEYQFVIGKAPSMEQSFYEQFIGSDRVHLFEGGTYPLLQQSHAALVTSGTATLETALFGVPEVVCYKGSAISYQIAKRLVNIKHISLVNLIMDREVVTELIQGDLNEKLLRKELQQVLDPEHRQRLASDYEALKTKLGGAGASAQCATSILQYLKS